MNYDIRNIISDSLWRKVVKRAGDRVHEVIIGLLRAYAAGKIDPLSDTDPTAAARGKQGGQARARSMSAKDRSASAREAALARWAKKRKG